MAGSEGIQSENTDTGPSCDSCGVTDKIVRPKTQRITCHTRYLSTSGKKKKKNGDVSTLFRKTIEKE